MLFAQEVRDLGHKKRVFLAKGITGQKDYARRSAGSHQQYIYPLIAEVWPIV
jgi:hypothetical protein